MKNLDEYGKGRQSVILEMIKWCEKEIEAIKKHGIDKDTHIAATMTGQMKAYIKAKQKLTMKNTRLKEIE
jgi:hypothetical protein